MHQHSARSQTRMKLDEWIFRNLYFGEVPEERENKSMRCVVRNSRRDFFCAHRDIPHTTIIISMFSQKYRLSSISSHVPDSSVFSLSRSQISARITCEKSENDTGSSSERLRERSRGISVRFNFVFLRDSVARVKMSRMSNVPNTKYSNYHAISVNIVQSIVKIWSKHAQ